MFGKNDYIDHLRQLPLFASLTKKEVATVAKAADEIRFPAGHKLLTEGESGSEAFVLLDGTVTIKRKGRKLATLGPGEIIGELALLDHAERTASVICDTDCILLVLDRRHFAALLQDTPILAIKFLQELAGRLRELDRTAFG